jgi:hypothetical protein
MKIRRPQPLSRRKTILYNSVAYTLDTADARIAESERLLSHINRKHEDMKRFAMMGDVNRVLICLDLIGKSHMKRAIILDELAAQQTRAIIRERKESKPRVPVRSKAY